MALLLVEGFDNFGTSVGGAPVPTGVITRKHGATTFESYTRINDGRFGGYSLKMVGNDTGYVSPTALTTNATMVVGLAIYTIHSGTGTTMLSFIDGSTEGMKVVRAANGVLAVYRGSTLLASSPVDTLLINQWYYIEFKVVCDATAGSYELRVNETTILSDSGINTKAGTHDYHDTFRVCGAGTASTYFVTYDDLYCLDGTGSINNDFLGNQRVVTVRPNVAGDSTQWTPSSGFNHACIDEEVANDDTDYVEASNTGDKDLYGYESVTGLANVTGVQVNSDCRETDANTLSLTTVCKSGSTESDDTAQTIGSASYVTRNRVVEADPDTGSAWTISGVNAAQFGMKVG